MAKETETETMATSSGSADTRAGSKDKGVGVRLVPSGDADLPILANFARVGVSPAGVIVDFGFLDPAGLNALARAARASGKLPEAVSGRLAGRFALTPDALVALHQQLGQAIAGIRSARKTASETKSS
jgi:hypothetical protein